MTWTKRYFVGFMLAVLVLAAGVSLARAQQSGPGRSKVAHSRVAQELAKVEAREASEQAKAEQEAVDENGLPNNFVPVSEVPEKSDFSNLDDINTLKEQLSGLRESHVEDTQDLILRGETRENLADQAQSD